MKEFAYYQPESISEACKLKSSNSGTAVFFNGGTDVMVRYNQGRRYDSVIDIKKIHGLDYIKQSEDGIHIGALVKISDIIEYLKNNELDVLKEALHSIGTPQIRNLGTLCGNICNSSPVADSAPALMVLGARLVIAGINGERTVNIEDFFTGPGKNILENDEMLKEVIIPQKNDKFYGAFIKLGPRKTADIAVVNAAAGLIFKDGICTEAKIALGAAAPTVIFTDKAQRMLIGKKIEEMDFSKAADAASEETAPISDIRSSKEYRKEMSAVLVERLLTKVKEEIEK